MDRSCQICGFKIDPDDVKSFGKTRGNTTRFLNEEFPLWRCPKCQSIHSLKPVALEDIYKDYPVNKFQRLDFFARGRLANLLKRLKTNGLKKSHTILDLGCGNGTFIEFLKMKGYHNVVGFDPYVKEYAAPVINQKFDFIVANDVIEHVEDPKDFLRQTIQLLNPQGTLYIGTADSEDVKMDELDRHIMRLHQPFHRIIFTQKSLEQLATELPGMKLIASYRRSYMDTLIPFINYRFLDEFNSALGHEMDKAFEPDAARVILRHPKLLFYAYFGYFLPSAAEPAVVVRKV